MNFQNTHTHTNKKIIMQSVQEGTNLNNLLNILDSMRKDNLQMNQLENRPTKQEDSLKLHYRL